MPDLLMVGQIFFCSKEKLHGIPFSQLFPCKCISTVEFPPNYKIREHTATYMCIVSFWTIMFNMVIPALV